MLTAVVVGMTVAVVGMTVAVAVAVAVTAVMSSSDCPSTFLAVSTGMVRLMFGGKGV